MTRVVIDTNVDDNKLTWCVSPAILAEYEAVLTRPKYSRVPRRLVAALLKLAAGGELVEPAITLTVSPHADDNRFLECADVAAAHFLVTGNKRHFPPRWKQTQIVNSRELLQSLKS